MVQRNSALIPLRVFVVLLVIAAIGVLPRASRADDALDARLKQLCERLERERKREHVAGMAVGVVKDDKVVLLRGGVLTQVERDEYDTYVWANEFISALQTEARGILAAEIAGK